MNTKQATKLSDETTEPFADQTQSNEDQQMSTHSDSYDRSAASGMTDLKRSQGRPEPLVIVTSAQAPDHWEITISVDEEKCWFLLSVENEHGVRRGIIEPQGTQTRHGQMRSSTPRDEIWLTLLASPDLLHVVELNRIDSIRRQERPDGSENQ